MFGIFKRLFRVAEAKTHHAIDQIEDPVKMTEQGIRDLKKDLQTSLQSMAEAKAVLIKMRHDARSKEDLAKTYEDKAILLLKKAENGGLAIDEADRLARSALSKKEAAISQAAPLMESVSKQETQTKKLELKINQLKSSIGKWESELQTLKARSTVAQASKNLNKQMAQIDSSSTLALLEKMRSKVDEDEAMAESYSEMASISSGDDDDIDSALARTADVKIDNNGRDSLAALKEKLNLSKPTQRPSLEQ